MRRRRRSAKPLPPFAPAGATLVYLEAGQSNSNGYTSGSATFSYTFTKTETYYKSSQTSSLNNGTFASFAYGTNTNGEGESFPDPSIYVAQKIEGIIGGELLKVIQVGKGGTGFENGGGGWAASGSLANALENHYIKPGLSTLQGNGDDVWLMPFLWVQGERDATSSTFANGYQSQLETFISNVRAWLGDPTFPFVLARLRSDIPSGSYPEVAAIQLAQQAIASADQNIWLINPDSFVMEADGLHYDEVGYEQIANAYLKLVKEKIGVRKWAGDLSVEITTQPNVSGQEETTVTIQAETAEYSTLYAGVYADSSANPGATAIKAGTGTGYVAHASSALVYDTSGMVQVTGLTASTDYECFAFCEDLAGNQSAIQSLAFATATSGGSPTVLFSDAFTDTNGTLLDAHTPDTGTSWTRVDNAGHEIQSNAATLDGESQIMGFVSVANFSATPTILQINASLSINRNAGFILRFIDNTQAILVQFLSPNIRLFTRSSGTWNLQSSVSIGAFTNGAYTATVEDSGSQIRAKLSSSATIATFNSTAFNSSDTPGIWTAGSSSTTTYDNFEVVDISAFTL